jgi:sugar transferase (PEP-CTERM/EpsH1 system associated)
VNVLWVKTAGLYPPDTGGKIRSYNMLRQIAREHSVTLFTFYARHEGDRNPSLAGEFDKAVCMPLAMPEPKSAGELLHYLRCCFSREPYNIAKYCVPAVRKALAQLLRRNAYDVIICDFVFAAGAIPWDWPCPKILFTHNVETTIWKRHFLATRNPLWKALSWREWRTMARAERRYLARADHILAVSESDRDELLRVVPNQPISVVRTGVDSEYFMPDSQAADEDSVVFTGSMDWLPNEDAVLYFLKEIFPLIRREVPETSFTVVGRSPSPRLKSIAASETRVYLTGWVEDVRPFLARSALCIVPLRIGGGTRIKIFEAMAMGKAVLSTSIGAEGLPVRDGADIAIADTPEEFARKAVALLRQPAERARLGSAGRRLVSERYSWAAAAEPVLRAIDAVASRPFDGNSLRLQRRAHHDRECESNPRVFDHPEVQ